MIKEKVKVKKTVKTKKVVKKREYKKLDLEADNITFLTQVEDRKSFYVCPSCSLPLPIVRGQVCSCGRNVMLKVVK
jgi:hypothetical protein